MLVVYISWLSCIYRVSHERIMFVECPAENEGSLCSTPEPTVPRPPDPPRRHSLGNRGNYQPVPVTIVTVPSYNHHQYQSAPRDSVPLPGYPYPSGAYPPSHQQRQLSPRNPPPPPTHNYTAIPPPHYVDYPIIYNPPIEEQNRRSAGGNRRIYSPYSPPGRNSASNTSSNIKKYPPSSYHHRHRVHSSTTEATTAAALGYGRVRKNKRRVAGTPSSGGNRRQQELLQQSTISRFPNFSSESDYPHHYHLRRSSHGTTPSLYNPVDSLYALCDADISETSGDSDVQCRCNAPVIVGEGGGEGHAEGGVSDSSNVDVSNQSTFGSSEIVTDVSSYDSGAIYKSHETTQQSSSSSSSSSPNSQAPTDLPPPVDGNSSSDHSQRDKSSPSRTKLDSGSETQPSQSHLTVTADSDNLSITSLDTSGLSPFISDTNSDDAMPGNPTDQIHTMEQMANSLHSHFSAAALAAASNSDAIITTTSCLVHHSSSPSSPPPPPPPPLSPTKPACRGYCHGQISRLSQSPPSQSPSHYPPPPVTAPSSAPIVPTQDTHFTYSVYTTEVARCATCLQRLNNTGLNAGLSSSPSPPPPPPPQQQQLQQQGLYMARSHSFGAYGMYGEAAGSPRRQHVTSPSHPQPCDITAPPPPPLSLDDQLQEVVPRRSMVIFSEGMHNSSSYSCLLDPVEVSEVSLNTYTARPVCWREWIS